MTGNFHYSYCQLLLKDGCSWAAVGSRDIVDGIATGY